MAVHNEKYDAFISYASEDKAKQLRCRLTWGADWLSVIVPAYRKSGFEAPSVERCRAADCVRRRASRYAPEVTP